MHNIAGFGGAVNFNNEGSRGNPKNTNIDGTTNLNGKVEETN